MAGTKRLSAPVKPVAIKPTNMGPAYKAPKFDTGRNTMRTDAAKLAVSSKKVARGKGL